MSAPEPKPPAREPSLIVGDDEVDEVIREAGGDMREAIRALIRDLAVMALDADAAVSRGFLRGRFSAGHRRPPHLVDL